MYNTRQRNSDENMSGLQHKGFNDRKPAAKRSALGDISNASMGQVGLGVNQPGNKGNVQISKKQTTLRARVSNNASSSMANQNHDLVAAATAAAASQGAGVHATVTSQRHGGLGTEVIETMASGISNAGHNSDGAMNMVSDDAAGPMLIDNTPRVGASSGSVSDGGMAGDAAAGANGVAEWEDIDVYDEDDAQCCTEYVDEIFAYMRQKEVQDAVRPDYLSQQKDINAKMRGILLDWMVDVHLKFKLLSETMFLSVSIIDRYLALHQVPRHRLQLVGITAMLIGSKFEEIWAPEVRDFVYICDRAFTREEILDLEVKMLAALNFSLTPPTALGFLRRFSKAARSDSRTHTLSKYLTELTLPDYGMLRFRPSCVAASAVFVARSMMHLTPVWTPTLQHYTDQSVDDIRECALALNDLLKAQPTASLRATTRKYSSSKLLKVATLPPVELSFN